MKKGLLAALFCAMIFLLLPAAAYAAGGNFVNGDEGSSDKPYQIEDAADLKAFWDKVNSNEQGACAVLTADIDLNNENWTPIGSEGAPFTGTFDGKGHTISGLYVNVVQSSDSAYAGLFGHNSGTIENVKIKNSNITATSEEHSAYAGGICGRNEGEITNCSSAGDVKVEDCYYYGYGGGICGRNEGEITNCSSAGDVKVKVYYYGYGGGICGYNEGEITNCSSAGDVTAIGLYYGYGGGICGYNVSGEITNCSSAGNVTVKGDEASYAGGICGRNEGEITNCSNQGDITSTSIKGSVYLGGVCGRNDGITIENCYFLSGAAEKGIGNDSGEATGKEQNQFASGEVAWLLDQGNTSHQWAQKLRTEDFPRPMMETGDEKYAVVRVLVHFPENAGDISCYTNINTVLSAYPSQMNGKKYAFYADANFETPIDTANYKYQKDTEIYAKEKKSSSSSAPTEYNLRFDTNGGDSMSTTVEQANTPIDLDQYVPTREGYKFVGWYADEELTKPIDTITLAENATIYAKWEKIEEEEEEIKEEEPTETEEEREETAEPEETAVSFADVRESDWFYQAVSYAVGNNLMSGMGDGTFSPNTPLHREMLAVILYNLAERPASDGEKTFTDVSSGQWYTEAILWAAENSIVAGYDDGSYGVGQPVTREEFAAILYRFANFYGYDTTVLSEKARTYSDFDKASSYAEPALIWAVDAGIITGMDDGTLAPQGRTTRAEAATMLMNFCENVAK